MSDKEFVLRRLYGLTNSGQESVLMRDFRSACEERFDNGLIELLKTKHLIATAQGADDIVVCLLDDGREYAEQCIYRERRDRTDEHRFAKSLRLSRATLIVSIIAVIIALLSLACTVLPLLVEALRRIIPG